MICCTSSLLSKAWQSIKAHGMLYSASSGDLTRLNPPRNFGDCNQCPSPLFYFPSSRNKPAAGHAGQNTSPENFQKLHVGPHILSDLGPAAFEACNNWVLDNAPPLKVPTVFPSPDPKLDHNTLALNIALKFKTTGFGAEIPEAHVSSLEDHLFASFTEIIQREGISIGLLSHAAQSALTRCQAVWFEQVGIQSRPKQPTGGPVMRTAEAPVLSFVTLIRPMPRVRQHWILRRKSSCRHHAARGDGRSQEILDLAFKVRHLYGRQLFRVTLGWKCQQDGGLSARRIWSLRRA